MVDVFILLDTAYSYSCHHPDLPSFIEDLVDAVFPSYENAAVGFATRTPVTPSPPPTASSPRVRRRGPHHLRARVRGVCTDVGLGPG